MKKKKEKITQNKCEENRQSAEMLCDMLKFNSNVGWISWFSSICSSKWGKSKRSKWHFPRWIHNNNKRERINYIIFAKEMKLYCFIKRNFWAIIKLIIIHLALNGTPDMQMQIHTPTINKVYAVKKKSPFRQEKRKRVLAQKTDSTSSE